MTAAGRGRFRLRRRAAVATLWGDRTVVDGPVVTFARDPMPHRAPRARAAAIESLEARTFCSSTTLRVASYNVEDDIDGYTAPRPGLATVLEGIGAFAIGTTARPIDVLTLEETTSNADTVAPIVSALNSYYGAGTYAASTLQLSESGGDAADGNGPSGLIYDTKTVQLLASVGLGGTLGASTGVYRQVGRYELEPVGGTAAGAFYVYVDHYKSGTGTANADKRAGEAAVVRQDEATLPSTARVIYAGDFNTNADGEGIFQTLMGAGQGQAFDALDPTGGVGNVAQGVATLTESATDLQYRDDYQMVTSNVLNDPAGLELVGGSEQAFGNNGSVAAGGGVDDASNTALAGLPDRSAVLSALTTASDHLPVVADYTVPLAAAAPPTVRLTGTTGGTAGSYKNDGNTVAKATDGSLSTYFDAPSGTGSYVSIDLGSAKTVTQIGYAPRSGYASRMVGGVVQASNSATFASGVVTAYTVPAAPASGTLTKVTPSTSTAYRYWRYVGPTGSSCNIAEFELFGAGVAQRTGTTIGTAGSNKGDGNTIAMATDGNLSTFFDAPTADGNFVGLDLGSAQAVSVIKYAPRSGYASRMVGGVFQASDSADFSSGVATLYTVTAAPPSNVLTTVTLSSAVTYRYYRYLSPNGSFGNVAEVQFFG